MIKRSIIGLVLLLGIMSSVSAIATVTTLNGTVVMVNKYNNTSVHTTAKMGAKIGLPQNNTQRQNNVTNRMGQRMANPNNGTSMGKQMNRRLIAPAPSIRTKGLCYEEMKNVTRLEKLARLQYREEIGKKLDMNRAQIILAGMNVVIKEGESYNANVTSLLAIRNEFMSVMSDMNASDGKQYIENARKLMQLTKQFRTEAHKIPALEEHANTVKSAVANAMKMEREKLKPTMERDMNMAKEVGLAVFDLHVCLAQNTIDRFKEMGLNTSIAQTQLEKVMSMRSELASAYTSGNRTAVIQIKGEIAKDWRAFYRSFMVLSRESIEHRYQMVREKMVNAIKKLKARGINTHKLEQRLSELDKMRNRLNSTNDMKNFTERVNNLNREIAMNARHALIEGHSREGSR